MYQAWGTVRRLELPTKQTGGQIFVFILSLTHPYSRQTCYDDANFP